MQAFLFTLCVAVSFIIQMSAAAEEVVKEELNDESKQILAKVTALREQQKKELEKISKKEERDLVETMAIEAEVKDLKASRPKRDSPPTDLLSLLQPKTTTVEPEKPSKPSQTRQARQALAKARRVRRTKQRRAAAARRNAKLRRVRHNRVAARHARARLIRRVQRAKIIQSQKKRAAVAAKQADQLKKE